MDESTLQAMHHNLHLLLLRQTTNEAETASIASGSPYVTSLKNFTRMRLFAVTGVTVTVDAYGMQYTYTYGESSIDISFPGSITISTTSATHTPILLIRDFERPQN